MVITHIEYLTIYCWLNISELILILNNSPYLKFLNVTLYDLQTLIINDDVYKIYCSLHYLHVTIRDIPFDFVYLLLKHLPQLRSLSVQGSCKDLDFIDGDYWRVLFEQNLFLLSKFRLTIRIRTKKRVNLMEYEQKFQHVYWQNNNKKNGGDYSCECWINLTNKKCVLC
ncbi:unnamed protein product [Didymodactylos carnosus]|uniref:Uncharacterized protein n=2 Tax=Didymodactylos carnosus TaxID=1234261 RepID=A0A815T1I4_9BILA|nr:unnamed protein product [Didymodactylos carnosus]CAF4359850.1 unnamed protein product [Didymodactylos carnosus]